MKPNKSDVLAVLRHLAVQGGKARAAKLSAEELTKIGKQGAAARWGKRKVGRQIRKHRG